MYGLEWLVGLGLVTLLAGAGAGYLLAARIGPGHGRARELEAALEASRQELTDYRAQVVEQLSETARKFQTLNDSYTDLHQQLARSSSVLCGDVTGPLLAAPAGHQDLIPAAVRGDGSAKGSTRGDPYDDDVLPERPMTAATDPAADDIQVAEPRPDETAAARAAGEAVDVGSDSAQAAGTDKADATDTADDGEAGQTMRKSAG